MTQGNTEGKLVGNDQKKKVNSESEIMIFENKIVPMWASTKVAAAMLGISPNALRIRKCRGEVECRYFGKYLRFNIGDLQSLFRNTREE